MRTHGGLPAHSFHRQIYHPKVKGGPPTDQSELLGSSLKQETLLLLFHLVSKKKGKTHTVSRLLWEEKSIKL